MIRYYDANKKYGSNIGSLDYVLTCHFPHLKGYNERGAACKPEYCTLAPEKKSKFYLMIRPFLYTGAA